MSGKNEKKIFHREFSRKLKNIGSEKVFPGKDFSKHINDKQSVEKADEIKNRIIDYYVQLYFLS
jgi:hypothetical protein